MLFYTDENQVTIKSNFPLILLKKDTWNDRGYETGFELFLINSFENNINKNKIGYLKIGKKGMAHETGLMYQESPAKTKLPLLPFESLEEDYFSVGQDETYYKNIIRSLDFTKREKIFSGLRDVAFLPEAFAAAANEKVFRQSLLRSISVQTIKSDFKNIIDNISATQDEYVLSFKLANEINQSLLEITVTPNSIPRSNLHALIGRNGVGKTYFLKNLIEEMTVLGNSKTSSKFFIENSGTEKISSILAIQFSMFDNTLPKEQASEKPDENKIRYTFIGFPLNNSKEKEDISYSLSNEFSLLVNQIIKRPTQMELVEKSIEILNNDPIFNDNNVLKWFNINEFDRVKEFNKLSSGHKIALLIVLEMIFNLEVNSLVLIDEPELHLHPPLLASLMKTINEILYIKNAVGIIATHSPVVLQEISSECVWIINRKGKRVKIMRPGIETFGENISTLTREVFGLEVQTSGYETLIKTVVKESNSLEEVFEKFDNKLSDNARLLATLEWEIRNDAGN